MLIEVYMNPEIKSYIDNYYNANLSAELKAKSQLNNVKKKLKSADDPVIKAELINQTFSIQKQINELELEKTRVSELKKIIVRSRGLYKTVEEVKENFSFQNKLMHVGRPKHKLD